MDLLRRYPNNRPCSLDQLILETNVKAARDVKITMLLMKFLYLEIELASSTKKIKFDDIKWVIAARKGPGTFASGWKNRRYTTTLAIQTITSVTKDARVD